MSASASLPTTAAADSPILAIEQLHIGIRQADRSLRRVVEDFQLSIGSGEIAALVGESGSGKTMIGRAIMRLLPGSAQVEYGRILLDGTDVAQASAARMRQLRGRAVGMVFQEPMVSLNPAIRVGQQMSEALRLHYGLGPEHARQRCLEMLERVRIADPVGCFQSYPHQFSGGMRQRIMLASVLAMQPRLLIADEPTTALDALVRKEVMDIMQALTREMGIAVLLVSHDLSMVAGYADQVTVLRLGRTMEQGPASRILLAPQQAYTRALLAALPARTEAAPAPGAEAPPLVEVSGLCVDYKRARSLLQRGPSHIRVVHETDFVLHPGQTLAVVGESGSGKSTLGRALVRLLKESAGSIRFEGQEVTALQGRALDPLRPKLQMVFQDPFSSLDPRMDLTAIVAEGLRNLPGLASAERQQRARAMLAEVGLPGDFARRYPHELSGGQRQRVCIARAIVAEPRLVVADEPVSALDVTVQEQVLALLRQLQKKFGFSYLFISHDLAVVEQVADRVAVMYRGRLLEIGSRDALFDRPQHPYTRRLLQATPRIRPTGENSYALVADEPPVQPAPAGYRHYNHGSIPGAALSTGVPVMVEVGDDHRVACVPLS